VNLGLEDVARKYLTEAVSIFQKLGDKIMETWVQLSFAYLYKNAGKYKEALAYFENIIVQGKTANNKELMNWGLYGAVELYLDAMNFEKANKYVQQIDAAWPGREKAKETDIKYELLRCKLAVYGEGEAGEPVRERLSELAELTTKFGLRELASEAYHVLGTLDEKTGNERVAAKDLATAKEILDDIVGSLSEEYRDSFLKQKYRAALSEESTRLNRSLNIEPQRIKRPEPPPSQQPSPAAPEAAPPRRQEATTVIPQQQAKAPPEKTAQLGAGQDAVQTSSFGGVKTSDYVVVKEDIVGQSDAVARVKDIIEHVKDSHMSVLIYGESGVGKDLVAKSIRKKGSYKNSPFLSIDIEEFPDEFLSDEIFGLEKEAMLEAAGNGIILLKHIEAMPKSVQKELEKAAKNRKFKRLRDKKEVSIACRFIATSRLGINELIKEKKFDKDLLKLLSQIPIHIPPLRDRVEDLPILINYILSVVDPARPHTIDNDALKAIVEHEWRGNIKELEHTLKAAMILATDGHITLPQIEIHLKRSA
jgi:predicted metal-dependent hydrolase